MTRRKRRNFPSTTTENGEKIPEKIQRKISEKSQKKQEEWSLLTFYGWNDINKTILTCYE